MFLRTNPIVVETVFLVKLGPQVKALKTSPMVVFGAIKETRPPDSLNLQNKSQVGYYRKQENELSEAESSMLK